MEHSVQIQMEEKKEAQWDEVKEWCGLNFIIFLL